LEKQLQKFCGSEFDQDRFHFDVDEYNYRGYLNRIKDNNTYDDNTEFVFTVTIPTKIPFELYDSDKADVCITRNNITFDVNINSGIFGLLTDVGQLVYKYKQYKRFPTLLGAYTELQELSEILEINILQK
ncbi:MAG: hypothetical protein VZS44_11550, partial [Bacilli bacterium]|nr:hypothetical protein [Bacilli bacterium]